MARAISDYSKVQAVIGFLVRGRRWLQPRPPSKEYLNVGCGPYPHRDFINVDWNWRPDIELCWDITKPMPLADEALRGIYSEHCLQDISLDVCRSVLREFWRMLKKHGIVRLVLPDAEIYLDLYQRQKTGEAVQFPYAEPNNPNLATPMMNVNRAFRHNGELLFAYDFETLAHLAREAGFSEVSQVAFGEGRDSVLLIDNAYRAIESLYAEATK